MIAHFHLTETSMTFPKPCTDCFARRMISDKAQSHFRASYGTVLSVRSVGKAAVFLELHAQIASVAKLGERI